MKINNINFKPGKFHDHGVKTSMCLLGERKQIVVRPIKETKVDSSIYLIRYSSEERRKKYICQLQIMVFCRINGCFV